MSWRDAEKVLMKQRPGTYLVRDSASDRYIFTISYRTKYSVHHTRLAQYGGNFCLGGPNSLVKADSLVSFIENSLQSCGKRRICMLMHPKNDSTGIEILELNYLLHRHELLPSLKYLCRVVIRNYVEKELLASLPLPPNIICYLGDPKYLVPCLFRNLLQLFGLPYEGMLEVYAAFRYLKRYSTIFAVSSGALPAAISIIRVSGKESRRCLEQLTGRKKILPRQLFFANIRQNGELIDRGMAVFLPGPKTSTGEDVAEFYVHGSRAVVGCLLEALGQFDSMQPAKAGEFTKRAFFNGKITLQEVQSLAYLLAARTQRQRRLALCKNTLDKAMVDIRKQLIEVRASMEASIDFGDDIWFQWDDIRVAISSMISNLSSIQEQMHRGTLINEGLKIVILGQTNVGKSSLFNRMVNRNMAIVSDIEGTTRDSLEATVQLSSIPVTIVDTAGIREILSDSLEEEGIQRTLRRAAEADIVIVVINSSMCKDLETDVRSVLAWCHLKKETPVLVALNKCDLPSVPNNTVLPWPAVKISCISGEGINALLKIICEHIDELCPTRDENTLVSGHAHRLMLKEAIVVLKKALKVNDVALVAELLRDVSDYISEMSGVVVNEEILDQIFSSFCIGK